MKYGKYIYLRWFSGTKLEAREVIACLDSLGLGSLDRVMFTLETYDEGFLCHVGVFKELGHSRHFVTSKLDRLASTKGLSLFSFALRKSWRVVEDLIHKYNSYNSYNSVVSVVSTDTTDKLSTDNTDNTDNNNNSQHVSISPDITDMHVSISPDTTDNNNNSQHVSISPDITDMHVSISPDTTDMHESGNANNSQHVSVLPDVTDMHEFGNAGGSVKVVGLVEELIQRIDKLEKRVEDIVLRCSELDSRGVSSTRVSRRDINILVEEAKVYARAGGVYRDFYRRKSLNKLPLTDRKMVAQIFH